MKFREYTPYDREACLPLFDSNIPRYFAPEERPEFAHFLANLPGPYFVIEDETGTIACGGYAPNSDGTIALCWGMVRKALHGSGLGRRLLQERLAHIRQSAIGVQVVLNTSQYTVALYQKFGFVLQERISDGYAPGLDRCAMILELSR